MPIAKVQLPDGRIGRFEVPDGTTPEQVMAFVQQNMPQTAPQAPPADEPGIGERFMRGLKDPVDAGAQLLTHALPEGVVNAVNDATAYVNHQPVIGPITKAIGMVPASPQAIDTDIQSAEKQYQARRGPNAGFDVARMAGNIAGTLPLTAALPASLPGAVAGGVIAGEAQPVTEKGNFLTQKLIQGAEGGAGGALGNVATRTIARAIDPQVSGAVKSLIARGVIPTPGQIAGGGAKAFEEKMTSVPVLGDVIKGGQRRAMDQFNRAAYDEVLAPIGETAPKSVGRQAIAELEDKIGNAYDQILPKLTFTADPQFATELGNLSTLISGLPEKEARQFNAFVGDKIAKALGQTGTMDGQTFKELESALGKEISTFGKSTDAYQQKLADAYKTVQQSLRDGLERSNQGVAVSVNGKTVDAAQRLRDVNAAYARLVRLQTAAGGPGASEGVFTPAQLSSAVRSTDRSIRKRAFARGDALMQDLSDAGKTVLGNVYPNSGTPGRLAAILMTGGAVPFSPAAAAGGAAMMLPYTSVGQRMAAALMAQRPNFAPQVGSAVRKMLPASQAALASILAKQ